MSTIPPGPDPSDEELALAIVWRLYHWMKLGDLPVAPETIARQGVTSPASTDVIERTTSLANGESSPVRWQNRPLGSVTLRGETIEETAQLCGAWAREMGVERWELPWDWM
jgi:hypothetical protein